MEDHSSRLGDHGRYPAKWHAQISDRLMQMLFQNEHFNLVLASIGISPIAGLLSLLMALLREFRLSSRLSLVCIATSILPAAALHLKSGRSFIFENYESVAFPSVFGIAAFGICLLYAENRHWRDYQFTTARLFAWVTIIAVALGCLTWIL